MTKRSLAHLYDEHPVDSKMNAKVKKFKQIGLRTLECWHGCCLSSCMFFSNPRVLLSSLLYLENIEFNFHKNSNFISFYFQLRSILLGQEFIMIVSPRHLSLKI